MVAGVFGGQGEARIPPFDAVAIDVGAIWDIQPRLSRRHSRFTNGDR
jgi:hypothetical protein